MSKYWTTKRGDRIKISQMDDNHLLKTISMLERTGQTVRCYGVNGDHNTYDVEDNQDYLNLLEEKGKRKPKE